MLSAPLRSEGGVIGIITLTRITPGQPYTPEDQSFLQELADRVALVITNARLYEELERRVAERTQSLQATNSELEAFSYSVSHDLRAPLRALDGFSLVLLEDYSDKIDEQGRNYLNRVRAASNKMAELIDALLALARVTRAPLRHEPVDLTALAEEIAAGLRADGPTRHVALTIAPGLAAAGDPRLLRGVLENLLGNAWKFTGKTELARIEVGAAPGEDPAKETVFFVRDNGAGFDMAHADRLFGAFQRLHGQAEFAGIGIGLASVQRIIARHGGRVWAQSAPGQGATFYFSLPAQ
jgi:light-regulated signal transduction histidine kinase (bacteriophytochrome)